MSCNHEAGAAAGCIVCDFEPFVKNNYFTGKMMGAAEFIAETHFHQEKMRLHQARLHGWGVVCGLNLLQHTSVECRSRYVRLEPGSAVDCCGHDILVAEEELVDLLSFKKVAALSKENPAWLHTLAVCIRFAECATENVPVLYDDCGCDDNGCAPNRILESYEFEVLVDPPLSMLRRLIADDLAAAVFARSAEGTLGANVPRFGYAPLVGTTLYALDAKQPQKLVTYDLATRHSGSIDLGADAFAIAARGDFAYVATAPKGGTAAVIQVFHPSGTTAIAPVDITGTTNANTVMLSTSSDPNRAAIVYVRESGALLAYAEDTTNGLKAASTSLGSVAAKLNAFLVTPDGAQAFAVDPATNKVTSITLATVSSAADASALPTTAKPSSFAYLEVGGKKWLAVASRTDKALYVLDVANLVGATGLLATIALEHPPEFVAVGASGSVYVTEEEGSTTYEQAVALAPLAAGQPAVLSAARMVDSSGLRLIGLLKNATVGVIATAEQIAVACDELIWNQSCSSCDIANCVMLGTIEHYQAGAAVFDAGDATTADDVARKIARIDNRMGRKILASTQTLQAWLECLQAGTNGANGLPGENGAPGDDGIGLYPDLPKILDIGWRFEETLPFLPLVSLYLQVLERGRDNLIERIKAGKDIPPLTIYFNKPMKGITRRTLEVTIDAPIATLDAATNAWRSAGVYWPIELKMYGEIVGVSGPLPTPHTGESAAYAVTFLPDPRFFSVTDAQGKKQPAWPYQLLVAMTQNAEQGKLDLPRVRVALKGDFVYAGKDQDPYSEFAVLDGDNVGGQVGEPPPASRQPPIKGGKNPSGNLTQGGLFESWFFLSSGDARATPLNEKFQASPLFRSFDASMLGMAEMPPSVNFSTAPEISAATGVSEALAARIVAERARRPFAGVSDFRKRTELSERDWTRLKDKLLIL
jgi:hypothetical protein